MACKKKKKNMATRGGGYWQDCKGRIRGCSVAVILYTKKKLTRIPNAKSVLCFRPLLKWSVLVGGMVLGGVKQQELGGTKNVPKTQEK